MKRILVTGGAGFIGSHTVDLLLKADFQVIVFDNLISGKVAHLSESHPALRFIKGDVLDQTALARAVAESDVVLHLAALPSVPASIENPLESLRVNSLGFLHVLQAIRDTKRSIRLVYASSAAVYGATHDLPCSDTSPLMTQVLSPYALEKVTNEHYADLYEKLFGIQSLGLRYFNVYGPRQDPQSPYAGVISKFIAQYQQDQSITIFGDGEQSRDFISVFDVARANVLSVQSAYTGILNIATGKAETLSQLAHYIQRAGQKPLQLQFHSVREGDIPQSYAAVEKAAEFLSFRSHITLAEGIRDLMGSTTVKPEPKISYDNTIAGGHYAGQR